MTRIFQNIFIFSILSVFIAGSQMSSFILLSFELNQLEIVQKYCVNKEKPEMKCNGKCYLADQLKKTEKKSDSSAELPDFKQLSLNLYLKIQNMDETPLDNWLKDYQEFLEIKHSSEFQPDIFNPPKFNA